MGIIRIARTWLTPSLPDVLFLALLAILLLGSQGPSGLLVDGDTGWHIRTGDYILANGHVPANDIFSFSRPGAPWFAWEWLSDVIFAALNQAWGLNGVTAFAALLIAAGGAILFRRMLAEQTGILPSLALVLLAVAASTVHDLARPHLFTYLLLPLGLWILERDLKTPAARTWLLAPLTLVWANLHAGFVAFLAMLAVHAVAMAFTSRRRAIRLVLLFAACSASTLVNPYGAGLHAHVLDYLSSSWIRDAVQEFQASSFRSESSFDFMLLLFGSLLCVPTLWKERRHGMVANLVCWAQAALQSARHIPVFSLYAAPMLAAQLDRMCRRLLPNFGWPGRPSLRCAVPTVLAGAACIFACMSPAKFPATVFPVVAADSYRNAIAGKRVLTTDQWADYLIYRFYPVQRVFMDGRSDFYGQRLAHEYTSLIMLQPGWQAVWDKYRFDAALLPGDCPLGEILRKDPAWTLRYQDQRTLLFQRNAPNGNYEMAVSLRP
jgi:hypothetical protein